jgi:hypothetical protein
MDTLDHIFGATDNWSTCVTFGEGQTVVRKGEASDDLKRVISVPGRGAVAVPRLSKRKPASGIAGVTTGAHLVARGLFGCRAVGRKLGVITVTKRCAVQQRLSARA